MTSKLVQKIDATSRKSERPQFAIGDTAQVHLKITEGGKERVQVFEGIIIARNGKGSTETVTLRRTSHGVGVERVFPIHSPNVTRIEIVRSGRVRRAKLYYLRDLTGKKARLRERVTKRR